jgi:hypothetical protein
LLRRECTEGRTEWRFVAFIGAADDLGGVTERVPEKFLDHDEFHPLFQE